MVFMVISGVEGGDGTGTVFAARVARMDVEKVAKTARVLPKTAALVPMKAKTPKGIGGGAVGTDRKIEPNPAANDFRQFVLGGQLGFEEGQNGLRRQFPICRMIGEGASF